MIKPERMLSESKTLKSAESCGFRQKEKTMLKLKKLFLAMMGAALAVTGFVSCSNDDDDSLPKSGPVSIVLTADDPNVEVGETIKISSKTSGLSFESSNESIATVDSDGIVTGLKVGDVTITARKGNDNDGTYEYSYTPGTIAITVKEGTTSYLINGKIVTVTSDGTKVTKATVDGAGATVSESNGTLTITSGETTLAASVSNGTIDTSTVTENGTAVEVSRGATNEEIEAMSGTIYVNETAHVFAVDLPNAGTTLVVKQSTDSDGNAEKSKVDITVPGISYDASMTITSFTIEDIFVSTTDSETFTLSLGSFTSTATTSDGEEKAVKGSSLSGTYVASTGKIELKTEYYYGSMPFPLTDSYTNNWADSYDSEYKISDLVGNGYTFSTRSGPHTFTVASESEIVYTMEVTAKNATYNYYITYTSQEVGKNVYLLTGYSHDDDPSTPATSGTARVYRVEITDKDTILLLASKTEATTKAGWYGTYTGTWTIMNRDYPMTVIVADSTLYYQSSMMTGSFEYVSWLKDDSGNWVCCGAHDAAPTAISDAATTVTFNASTSKGSFAVKAMATMGAAEITKSSSSTTVPTSE